MTAVIAAIAVPASPADAQTGALFPEPFRVEHHLVQEDGEGSRFVGEPVVDTYGGSWIVSQRPDGSRLVVDLVRRELSEVRPDKGGYWTVSFDRLAELQKRLRRVTVLARPEAKSKVAAVPAKELIVTEVGAGADAGSAVQRAASAASGPSTRPGVQHLRVAFRGESALPSLDVWMDPSIRLTPAALSAITALEAGALSVPTQDDSAATAPGRFLAAARAYASGAFPIRTVRPVATAPGSAGIGQVEDVATRVERLERFPSDLAAIPEGLRRVPHPLEATVRFLEEEAERNAAMAGTKGEVHE